MTVLTVRTSTNTPPVSPSDRSGLRLSLRPSGPQVGLLDGAWWPRSRDLRDELPALAAQLDPLWGRITRVAVNPAYWSAVPREVPVRGHVVKVGGFRTAQDPHQLLLLSYRIGRWDLLVVPPEADPDVAARLMAAACDPRVVRTASSLIAAQAMAATAAAVAAWEVEGGATVGRLGAPGGRR